VAHQPTPSAIPSPDETLLELSWLHPEIHRAFEHGVFKAKAHFETEQLERDAFAFSTLIRLHAKHFLRGVNLEAVDIQRVNLVGLALKVGKYNIRIWKAEDSELPAAGDSTAKQAFYQQALAYDDDGEPIASLNLAVLWNLDGLHHLSSLWLVCPKYGDEKAAEAHWSIRIPDPILSAGAVISPRPPEDLEAIKPKKESKIQTG